MQIMQYNMQNTNYLNIRDNEDQGPSISFSTPLITTSLIPTNIIKLQTVRNNSVGDNRTEIEYYQITSISYDTNGVSNIEASHFPLNNSNVSQITNELLTGSYTVLQ